MKLIVVRVMGSQDLAIIYVQDVSSKTPETWVRMTLDHQKNWKTVVLVDDHGGAVFVKNEIGLKTGPRGACVSAATTSAASSAPMTI